MVMVRFGLASFSVLGCVLMFAETPAPSSPPRKKASVTYSANIATILKRSCVSCHRPGGGAPFSLIGYENARKWSEMASTVTRSRYMPPWKAVHGYVEFLDENRLTEEEIGMIEKWAELGSPRGDLKEEPATPSHPSSWPIREPDLVLQMEKPFSVGASGSDVYRSFILRPKFKKPTWIKAVAVKPGDPTVVHHVIVFLDSTTVSEELAKNAEDGLPGIPDHGGAPGFIPTGLLGTWAPGSNPREWPKGAAMLVGPKDKIVIQVHYHKTGKATSDQTSVGLYFAKEKIQKEMSISWILNRDLVIPPGEEKFVEKYDQPVLDDMTIHSAFPHMHNLGQSMKAEARLPDGTVKPLVWVENWDFRWQLTYTLKEPVRVPKDSVIHIEAIYDNSLKNPLNPFNPPRVVKHGKKTNQEMLLLLLGYTLDKQTLKG